MRRIKPLGVNHLEQGKVSVRPAQKKSKLVPAILTKNRNKTNNGSRSRQAQRIAWTRFGLSVVPFSEVPRHPAQVLVCIP